MSCFLFGRERRSFSLVLKVSRTSRAYDTNAQVRCNNNARVVGLTSLASIQTSPRVHTLAYAWTQAKELARQSGIEQTTLSPHSLGISKKTMTRIPGARLCVMLQFECRERVIHNSRLTALERRFNPLAGTVVYFHEQSVQCYMDAVQL